MTDLGSTSRLSGAAMSVPSRSRRIGAVPPDLLAVIGGALAWEVVARLWNVQFLPPLSAVLRRLVELVRSGVIIGNLGNSLVNLAAGFGISVVAGIGIGALMGRFRRVEQALDVYVYALLTAPSLVFAPIFFSVFGLGRASIVAIIVQNTVFGIIVNTLDGVKASPPELLEMATMFGARTWRVYRRVAFPSAVPMIMVGLQVGAAAAVKGMVTGEMFLAIVGLGGVVIDAGKRFDAAGVLAVVLIVVVIALVLSKLLKLLEARLTRWLPAHART